MGDAVAICIDLSNLYTYLHSDYVFYISVIVSTDSKL